MSKKTNPISKRDLITYTQFSAAEKMQFSPGFFIQRVFRVFIVRKVCQFHKWFEQCP